MFWNEKIIEKLSLNWNTCVWFAVITTLFNKLNVILKLQIYIDLVTGSHSDCSLARSWEPAGISREPGFFQESLHISLAARFKLAKEEREKRENWKKKKKKERKNKIGEKRKKGKRKKIFFHLFFAKFHARWMNHQSEGSEAWKVTTILLVCFSVLHVTVTRRFQFSNLHRKILSVLFFFLSWDSWN